MELDMIYRIIQAMNMETENVDNLVKFIYNNHKHMYGIITSNEVAINSIKSHLKLELRVCKNIDSFINSVESIMCALTDQITREFCKRLVFDLKLLKSNRLIIN